MAEAIRVAINGFGVMGRHSIRAHQKDIKEGRLKEGEMEFVAVNDIAPISQLAPLLEHDSVYLGFDGEVVAEDDDIIINGKRILGFSEKEPSKLPWGKLGIDVVYESSGVFADSSKVRDHLKAGARKVYISAPSEVADVTIVPGINNHTYDPNKHSVVSGGSCTTNCLAPMAKAFLDRYGLYYGYMITTHAYTNDQRLVDTPHKDPPRAYAAALNIIPTTTGAAKAIGKVIPELEGRLHGTARRVGVGSGSLVDLIIFLDDSDQKLSEEEVNKTMKDAADGYLKGILGYAKGPLVSSMILGKNVPSTFDASQTHTNSKGEAKGSAWYDNVTGFSHQVIKGIGLVGRK